MMARRIVAGRRRAAGGGSSLLSLYPGAAAAYSLRDLTGLNPDLILVRRSTDNAEQAFSASGISNGSLEAWCGSGSGFVRTWYDQSGNGHSVTQTNPASQPKIVDVGVLVSEDGKAALDFDGVDDRLSTPYNQEYLQPLTYFIVFRYAEGSRILGAGGPFLLSQRALLYSHNGTFTPGAGATHLRIIGYSPQVRILASLLFDTTNSSWWVDGGFINDANAGTNTTVGIAFAADGDGLWRSKTKYQECIFYPSDQSANRVGIESNINDHYGIY